MTSLLASPQQGADAAATALVPTVAACTDTGEAGRVAELTPASPACLACGAESMPGDDLCRSHGGMTDGIERHAAMRAVA